ncbi:glutamyl-tRNA reductase [Ketobacter alkanivorans]|uniref:Glutamyl-tRNA reductase n=1 Tax=Ketobacter alkanivorans TaxID=1917421 RepID=A0A2K9LP63_9GAMM|nr:glutamyl-tRNA reductase [Ketobacter alkanivorans]AUM14027.1 glutamyl-tRNA reductase [Ketobacter alkanivorans]MCP5017819.1 glutamyl-tRNA reductase [Ketobacter sp.]
MALLAYGINHRTASVDLREKLAFSPDRVVSALNEVRDHARLREVAILSTCNRTELYCSADAENSELLLSWLGRYHALPVENISRCVYEFWNEAAVRHLMRVASGLDSMVLGEPQILGQLKTAYSVAQEAHTVGPELGRLFQHSFSAAKQIRTETGIGTNPVSVAFASVKLAKRIFSDLGKTSVLLIGAGETVELVARHLVEQGVKSITVANRTLSRANAIAEEFKARAITLSDIPLALPHADIVISSTASPLPILGKGAVEHALKIRKHKPMFMMDIAVPRDIEEEVSELADVYLYTVDDLQQVVEENRRQRKDAASKAETLVDSCMAQFMDSLKSLDAVDAIRNYRDKLETLRQLEMEKALQQIRSGTDAEVVMQRMSRSLINKVMHAPTTQLKQAAETGRNDQIEWAQQLLGIIEPNKPD